MDDDDPEKRIAELERRLAEARGTSPPPSQGMVRSPGGGWLSPEDVRNVAFAKPPAGKRGYNEDEVDQFLHRVEAALRDPTGRTLTAEQVHTMVFNKPRIGRRGYNEDEVDAFLDVVEEQLRSQQRGFPPPAQSAPTPSQPSTVERLQKLEGLRASGVISDAEYTAKRAQIIAEI